MKLAYLLNSGAPLILRYKVASTFATAGGYATNAIGSGAGVVLGLVTTAADQVGSNLDTATYSTTQGDAEGVVSILISPDAVYQIRMGRSATAGTALQVTTNSAAETAGTIITITTGDDAPNSPEKDEGTIACISGANLGQSRKITTTGSATAYTVLVPFENDIAAGDQFLAVPWTPADVAGNNVQLTTNLTEARQDIAVGTGADLRIVELKFDFSSVTHARNHSHVYAKFDDPIYGVTT